MGKTIIVGADHAGFALKEELKVFLKKRGYSIYDVGTFSSDPVDYPDIAKKVVKKVQSGKKGILVCGSGVGMSIAANRFPRIRAALIDSIELARLAREHNDANILCLSGRMISSDQAKNIAEAFFHTKFSSASRHHRRVKKMG